MAEAAILPVVAVPPVVAVLRAHEVSPDRVAAAVKAGHSPAGSAGIRVANAGTRVANAGIQAANTVEAIVTVIEATVAAIAAAMAIAAVFTDTTALRIITAAATATIPDITITIAAPATTINGATGSRLAATIPTTILTSPGAAWRAEPAAPRFGGGDRAGRGTGDYRDRIRLRPLPPGRYDRRPTVFSG